MLSERVKPFKWKPFDLYNDICIERYRKINSPPIKTSAATASTCRGPCCDNSGCNRDRYQRPPDRNDRTHRKSFAFGTSEPDASDEYDDRCESNRKSNGFRVRDKFAANAIDGDNNGVNWPLSTNAMAHAPFTASAYIGSAGSSCGSSSISSLSPSSAETKLDNKIDAKLFRRSIDSALPIVYGPLPYSKYTVLQS